MASLALADLVGYWDHSIIGTIFADEQASATLIGVILTGLLGFGGVAWTLSHNAGLERIRSKNALKNEIKKSEIQRDEEVRGIAAALAGEAQNLFRALNGDVPVDVEKLR